MRKTIMEKSEDIQCSPRMLENTRVAFAMMYTAADGVTDSASDPRTVADLHLQTHCSCHAARFI